MALDAWVRRFLIFSDGISYLEIADAYARRDWSAALNSHWSPMYSWLLALANVVIRPSPEWAVPVLHAVQVAAILAVLPAFEYLLKKVSPFAANAKVFRIASYAALIWVVIVLVSAGDCRPDCLLLAPVCLVSGLLLVDKERFGTAQALALGGLLGFSYLAKSSMLPLGFVALFAAALLFRKRMALLAFASMMLIVTPWIVVLSVHDGRPTIGAAGSLNYSWLVSGFRLFTHAREGTHPTRQIGENPEVFEFAQPIPGSYPPWRDPAYWNGGLPVRFSLSSDRRVCGKPSLYLDPYGYVPRAPGSAASVALVGDTQSGGSNVAVGGSCRRCAAHVCGGFDAGAIRCSIPPCRKRICAGPQRVAMGSKDRHHNMSLFRYTV